MVCWFSGSLFAQTDQEYQLSTHILDINRGIPASGVTITLFRLNVQAGVFEPVESAATDVNGRIGHFLPAVDSNEGIYKLKFETRPYFQGQNINSIYPYIEVVFEVTGQGHYHIPITVSANGYATYRGS